MKLATLTNGVYQGAGLIFHMARVGSGLTCQAIEYVADKVSKYIADPLSDFHFATFTDVSYGASLAYGAVVVLHELSPLALASSTILATGLVTQSKSSWQDIDKCAYREWLEKNPNSTLSRSEVKEMYPEEWAEVTDHLAAEAKHLRVTSSLAHVNILATALLMGLANPVSGLISHSIATYSLIGVFSTTTAANAYHFVKRRALKLEISN